MKWFVLFLAFFTVIAVCSAQEHGGNNDRVRAKQPSSVTVEGRADQVAVEKHAEEERSAPAKVGAGIRSGAAWTGRTLLRFTGWLVNTDQVVPYEEGRGRDEGGSKAKK